jgi:hypothetical protein
LAFTVFVADAAVSLLAVSNIWNDIGIEVNTASVKKDWQVVNSETDR